MSKWIIAAIPAEDDRVWKLSSEKVPHLTILFLGEHEMDQMAPKVAQINEFLEHVAQTSLKRFGLSVDRRGVLGEEEADVLFFDKDYSFKDLFQARSYLLTNDVIAEAYHSADQFPEWTPHLTLGYPETPAHDDDVEYPINWVEFDRIALWTSDYEGNEILLPKYNNGVEDVAMTGIPSLDKVLEHYGIPGMKWGVRKRTDFRTSESNIARASLTKSEGIRVTSKKVMSDKTAEDAILIGKAAQQVRDSMLGKDRKSVGKIMNKVDSNYEPDDLASKQETLDRYNSEMSSALTKFAKTKLPDGLDAHVMVDSKNMTLYVGTPDMISDVYKGPIRHALKSGLSTMKFDLVRDKNRFITDIVSPIQHLDDFLEHYGIPGMKWGVRRRTGDNGLVVKTASSSSKKNSSEDDSDMQKSADFERAAKAYAKAREKGVQALSNEDLKAITNRISAEKTFNQLTTDQKSELQKKVDQLRLEKDYRQLSSEKAKATRSMGRKILDSVMDSALDAATEQAASFGKEMMQEMLGKKESNDSKDSKSTKKSKRSMPFKVNPAKVKISRPETGVTVR